MNAAQRVSDEVERLEGHAVQLHRRMAEEDVSEEELKGIREELALVLERLKEAQHQIFASSLGMSAAEGAPSSFDPMRPAGLQLPQGRPGATAHQPESSAAGQLVPIVEASQRDARELMKAAGSGGVPLGQRLLAGLRRNLGPTLAEQLEGQDSPFQPPTLISSALEKTLRQHMASVRRDMADMAEEDRPSLPQEMGKALVELLRELGSGLRRDMPRGGLERLQQMERLNSAAQAGEVFQKALWHASAQEGRRVSVRLGGDGGESVEVAVSVVTTFDGLKRVACSYWRIDPLRYVMADQYDVQFLGQMPVLEGLQLSPAGTRLQLNPLYNVERAQKLAGRGKAASGGAQGVDLANLAKGAGDDVKQEKRGDDSSSSDEDEAEEDKNIKVATFGYGDGKMTRCVMLTGVVQTVLLIAFLYLAAALRLNMGDSKRACASLEGAFADRLFVEKRGDGRLEGTIRSFRTINAFGQYTQWLREVVPEVLFGLTAETAASAGAPPTAAQRLDLPAVVEGHTVLLGGLRLLQSRSKTVDRDRCGAAPFVSVNRHRYPHSTFTSMVDPSILTQRIGRDVDPTDLPAVSEALGDAFGAIDFGNVSLCYLQGEVDTAPFGPMAAGASSSSALYARYASLELPTARCLPSCDEGGVPGLLGAFVYRNSSELGMPYSLFKLAYHEGGFAITLPGNITRRDWSRLMAAQLEDAWLDRQTRSVDMDLHMYNAQLDSAISLQLRADFDVSGSISTATSCVALDLSQTTLSDMLPELFCLLWLTQRGLQLASRLFVRKKPEPGQRPVRCVITIELVVHLITTGVGLYAAAVRAQFIVSKLDYESVFRADQPWPPPYSGSLGALKQLLSNSTVLYAWALLTCTLRFALYYSIVSKKLYVLRLTISRATGRLIPSLFFVVVTLVAFAIGGNQLYASTTYEWRSPIAAIGTTLYLLRRPFGMPWEQMRQSSLVWPMDSEEPSPVMIAFLIAFTCTTIWVMANLYKAVIVIEFSTVVREYNDRQPGDLHDDPWPSFSPVAIARKQSDRYKDFRFRQRLRSAREREFQLKLAEQKRKQRELRARNRSGAGAGGGGAAAPADAMDFEEAVACDSGGGAFAQEGGGSAEHQGQDAGKT